ncbi:beta-aspartyl-peptidase [Bacillaceae bacterium S4-13-56]
MITIIRNGEVYAPEYLGKKDIALINDKIGFVGNDVELSSSSIDITEIDATGKIIVPGLIDSHVHITGGGGEGSFHTRTPELKLTDATLAGVTTVVGVIGTDGTTRTMTNLIAKARALNEEGITCYAMTGSYQVPVRTLTGRIEDDIMMIDLILGTGEIAIADHRSTQPTREELARIASESRIGGMLSGKPGIVNIHVGDGKDQLRLIEEVVETTDVPMKQFYPTHINRNRKLFEAGIQFAQQGGYVDFTTSALPNDSRGDLTSSRALKEMLDAGVPIDQITFTSDAQGSLPRFNEKREFVGLGVGEIKSLLEAVRDAVLVEGIPLETAIRVSTANPATILKLSQKGAIEKGKDADLTILSKGLLEVDTVFAMGQVMVQSGKTVVKGAFE